MKDWKLLCVHVHLRHGSSIALLIHDKITLLRHFKNGDVKQATIQTSSCFTWILSSREQPFHSPFHYRHVTSIIDVTSFIDYDDYNGTTDLKWFGWHWDSNQIKKYNTSSLVAYTERIALYSLPWCICLTFGHLHKAKLLRGIFLIHIHKRSYPSAFKRSYQKWIVFSDGHVDCSSALTNWNPIMTLSIITSNFNLPAIHPLTALLLSLTLQTKTLAPRSCLRAH